MKTRLFLALLASASIVGCATQAQLQNEAIAENTRTTAQGYQNCLQAVTSASHQEVLRKRFASSLEQLADTKKATDEEAKALFAGHAEAQRCRQGYLDQIVKTSPSFVPVMVATFNRSDEILVALVQRRITWGEFASRKRASDAQGAAEWEAEAGRIFAELQQSHQAELARRQSALNALAAYAQRQQMIDAMSRTLVTACSGFGNAVRCTTQ